MPGRGVSSWQVGLGRSRAPFPPRRPAAKKKKKIKKIENGVHLKELLEGREEVDPTLVTFPFPPVLPVRLLHVKLVGSVGEEDQTPYGLKNLT